MGVFGNFSWAPKSIWKPEDKFFTPALRIIEKAGDGVVNHILRRNRRGRTYIQDSLRLGPNSVHWFITHRDGSITDLGINSNLLTNIGRDIFASFIGDFQPAGNTLASNISTATSGTSITGTGSVWTASNLATPQLGCAGRRVFAAPHTVTNPVVWGNAISNTTNVITVDKWWKLAASAGGPPSNPPITGTTPTSGDAFTIGQMAPPYFLGLTLDSGAAAAADTVLASEITASGAGRALATYAHTMGNSSLTLSVTFSITGTLTGIHKGGLFNTLETSPGTAPMLYETVISTSDANVINGDSLTATWTITLSG